MIDPIKKLRDIDSEERFPDGYRTEAADLIEQQSTRIEAISAKCALLAASLAQEERRAEKLEQDAERYRWLRDFDLRCKDGVNINPPCAHVHASMYSHAVGTIPAVRLVTGDELDRAIDAAISQSSEPK